MRERQRTKKETLMCDTLQYNHMSAKNAISHHNLIMGITFKG